MVTKARILAIDNEPDILEVVSIYFSDVGYEIMTAKDGYEGLRLAERFPPDVVLLDIRMPGLNGVEIMKYMNTRWPRIPVIVVSALTDVEIAKGTLRRGSFDYVRKPFDLHDLHRSVVAALGHDTAQAS